MFVATRGAPASGSARRAGSETASLATALAETDLYQSPSSTMHDSEEFLFPGPATHFLSHFGFRSITENNVAHGKMHQQGEVHADNDLACIRIVAAGRGRYGRQSQWFDANDVADDDQGAIVVLKIAAVRNRLASSEDEREQSGLPHHSSDLRMCFTQISPRAPHIRAR
jgi:hypothetical protein